MRIPGAVCNRTKESKECREKQLPLIYDMFRKKVLLRFIFLRSIFRKDFLFFAALAYQNT